ncbi:MAG: pitrilysin family protein [candidate division FCPU426 bacterium]
MKWQRTMGALAAMLLCGAALGKNEVTMTETVQDYQLANGLRVVAKPLHHAPVVSVYIWYRVGSRQEPAGQSGLAHFLEHMLFKGTKQYGKGEIARLIGRTGGEQNAFTSQDYTAYFETVPAEYLELALKIESDRMVNALLNPKEFEQERTVILSELDGYQNHPDVRLRDLVNAQTWLNHPYRRPVIGWRNEVAALTCKQLKQFYQAYYQPANATLVVVGDFDPHRLRYLVQRNFGALRSKPISAGLSAPVETQRGERRVSLSDHGPAAIVRMNIVIPPAGHPDHFPLTVLNDALTKGKASRLYRALVESGLAVSVGGGPLEMIDPGYWTFVAVCQRGVAPQTVEKALLDEFERVKNQLLEPEEFQRSVNQTRAELVYAKDSLTDQAMLMGFYQTVAGDWRLLDQYPQKVAEVTREQIQAAARNYLQPERMTVGFFEPVPGEPAGPLAPAPQENLSWRPLSDRDQAEAAWPQAAPPASAGDGGKTQAKSACQRYQLANGLTLLVERNPANPMFVLSGLIRGGLLQEPEDKPGLAFAHAQLLDRGTARHTARELATALEFKGAHLSFAVRLEELTFSGEALKEDMELLLGQLAECLLTPTFPQEELDRVKKQLLTGSAVAKDNAESQAWQGFSELAYGPGHPMTRSLITAEPGLERVSRRDLEEYHKGQIRPQGTIISLAGDLDPEQVRQWVERLFSAWEQGQAEWKPVDPTPMPKVKEIKTHRQELPGKQESMVVLGHEGLRRLDADYYPAFVANQVLGGAGLSSQLMREVRDRAGLTYGIYSMFKLSRGVRPWCLFLQTDPSKVDQAVALSLAEMKKIQSGLVSEQMLDDAREQLVGELALGLETNAGLAYLNREIEYHSLGDDYRRRHAEAIRAVTFPAMKRAAKIYFHPQAYLLSVAEPIQPQAPK